jgi:hypothetical protein
MRLKRGDSEALVADLCAIADRQDDWKLSPTLRRRVVRLSCDALDLATSQTSGDYPDIAPAWANERDLTLIQAALTSLCGLCHSPLVRGLHDGELVRLFGALFAVASCVPTSVMVTHAPLMSDRCGGDSQLAQKHHMPVAVSILALQCYDAMASAATNRGGIWTEKALSFFTRDVLSALVGHVECVLESYVPGDKDPYRDPREPVKAWSHADANAFMPLIDPILEILVTVAGAGELAPAWSRTALTLDKMLSLSPITAAMQLMRSRHEHVCQCTRCAFIRERYAACITGWQSWACRELTYCGTTRVLLRLIERLALRTDPTSSSQPGPATSSLPGSIGDHSYHRDHVQALGYDEALERSRWLGVTVIHAMLISMSPKQRQAMCGMMLRQGAISELLISTVSAGHAMLKSPSMCVLLGGWTRLLQYMLVDLPPDTCPTDKFRASLHQLADAVSPLLCVVASELQRMCAMRTRNNEHVELLLKHLLGVVAAACTLHRLAHPPGTALFDTETSCAVIDAIERTIVREGAPAEPLLRLSVLSALRDLATADAGAAGWLASSGSLRSILWALRRTERARCAHIDRLCMACEVAVGERGAERC